MKNKRYRVMNVDCNSLTIDGGPDSSIDINEFDDAEEAKDYMSKNNKFKNKQRVLVDFGFRGSIADYGIIVYFEIPTK